jgi:hypothetical protein
MDRPRGGQARHPEQGSPGGGSSTVERKPAATPEHEYGDRSDGVRSDRPVLKPFYVV